MGNYSKIHAGTFFLGVDEDSSSSSLLTDDLGIMVMVYIIKQGVGGSGFGLDIGVASRPLNGWNFGLSIINVMDPFVGSKVVMNQIQVLTPYEKFYPFKWGDDELSSDEYIEYTFTIDTIRVDKMSKILYLKMRQGFLKYHQMQKILSRECQLHFELEFQKVR